VFARDRYRRLCLQWALRRADAVFAVSENLRRFAIDNGADAASVRSIPNGIDAAIFHPRDRAACRAKFGMRPDHHIVVCAGELIEAKGHHLVIQAVRDLIAEGHSVTMYIAGGVARGGAPFDHEIRRRIAEWNLEASVHVAGWVKPENLAELLCAADVFCLASFTEGWPNVVNEALACGTPVVATRVGAVPEMLPAEEYGFIVPPRELEPLTNALRRALFAPWDRNVIAARGLSRSWEDVAREVTAHMREVIPNAERRPSIVEVQPVSSAGDRV
jgi:teichuronic acid biosynthesis glycosyltransferase TuaC